MHAMAKNYDVLLKVLLVGDLKSHKTKLLRKFSTPADDGDYALDNVAIGLDYNLKDIVHKGKKIKLQIWDTAGQERFRSVTSSYYRGSQGCLLVYNTRNMATFSGLVYWLEEIKLNAPETFQTVLVGLSGHDGDDEVDIDMVKQFAKEHSLTLVTVDITNTQQVNNAFDSLVDRIITCSFQKRSIQDDSVMLNSGRRSSRSDNCFC